jgi:site-specific recombinase
MECEKENEKKAKELKFSRVDDAVEWIRAHKAEVALGTVVIIAGVAFVITTGGSGALILAPLAL